MFRKTPAALLAAATLVVVTTAGSATAAALITGKDVKNGTLTGKDVKASSLAAKHIKDGSLTGADVKDSALTGADVANGSVAEGDLASGVQAKLNAPAVSGYEVVTSTTEVPTDGEGAAYVACTAGKLAVGGGGGFGDLDLANSIETSIPQTVIRGDALLFDDAQPGFADGWKVHGKHNGLDAQELTAYVICVDPS